MKIYRASNKDFEEVFQLLEQLWPKEGLVKAKIRKLYRSQLKSGKIFLLAKKDKDVIGLISLSIKLDIQNQGKVGQIEELIVDESNRGNGVGKKLIEEIDRIAKKKGCLELDLSSNKKRKKAHKFYRKLGFKDTAYLFWRETK